MPLNMDITENNEKSENVNNQETGHVDGNITPQSASHLSDTKANQDWCEVPVNILTSMKSMVEIITAREGSVQGN